ncbi:MAG: hypothetical protein ACFFG0_07855 [Candidatus Thorarchaeota archaeon]
MCLYLEYYLDDQTVFLNNALIWYISTYNPNDKYFQLEVIAGNIGTESDSTFYPFKNTKVIREIGMNPKEALMDMNNINYYIRTKKEIPQYHRWVYNKAKENLELKRFF